MTQSCVTARDIDDRVTQQDRGTLGALGLSSRALGFRALSGLLSFLRIMRAKMAITAASEIGSCIGRSIR